jgi:hypothetical protein
MTDSQIIAIAITVLAVLAGSVFNSVRIGDLNRSVNLHIDDMRDALLAGMDGRFESMRAEMDLRFERVDGRFERMDSKLDTIISMLGQLDTRVTKLEGRIH